MRDKKEGISNVSNDFVERAKGLIEQGNHSEAQRILEEGIASMPEGWTWFQVTPDCYQFACWEQEEFVSISEIVEKQDTADRAVLWSRPSYSRAYYYLGSLALERGKWDEAISAFDKGLELDPERSQLLSEKGFVLSRQRKFEEALAVYQKAGTCRWASDSLKARILRGQGAALMALERLDEAETVLKQSLVLQKNGNAERDLQSIDRLRKQEQCESKDAQAFESLTAAAQIESPAPTSGDPDRDFVTVAQELVNRGKYDEATKLLEKSIAEIPCGWKAIQDFPTHIVAHCWNYREFLSFSKFTDKAGMGKTILLVPPSYSRAWYLLAFIAIERENYESALKCLDEGLALEPDQPELLSEKAYALSKLRRREEALLLYREATGVRPWMPSTSKARALIGIGETLIDLGRLDDAEDALRASLPTCSDADRLLDDVKEIFKETVGGPGNVKRARDLLEVIHGLRTTKAFDPRWIKPTNKLTVDLLAEIDSLPTVVGPRKVGNENFRRLLNAFRNGGWDAFEKEFWRVFPAGIQDLHLIKEYVLRDPVFHPAIKRRQWRLEVARLRGGKDEARQEFLVMNDSNFPLESKGVPPSEDKEVEKELEIAIAGLDEGDDTAYRQYLYNIGCDPEEIDLMSHYQMKKRANQQKSSIGDPADDEEIETAEDVRLHYRIPKDSRLEDTEKNINKQKRQGIQESFKEFQQRNEEEGRRKFLETLGFPKERIDRAMELFRQRQETPTSNESPDNSDRRDMVDHDKLTQAFKEKDKEKAHRLFLESQGFDPEVIEEAMKRFRQERETPESNE
jgi:tetratricopeptide (TPR) repeat protein